MNPIAPETPAPLDALDRLHDWLSRRPRRALALGILALYSPITVPLIAWAINLGANL